MRINLIGKKNLLFKRSSFTIEVGVQEKEKGLQDCYKAKSITNDIYKEKI